MRKGDLRVSAVFAVLLAVPIVAVAGWDPGSGSGGTVRGDEAHCLPIDGRQRVGALENFQHTVGSSDIHSHGQWGAHWDGNRLPVCELREDGPVKVDDTVTQSWTHTDTSGAAQRVDISVATLPAASGTWEPLQPAIEGTWWTPVVYITEYAPKLTRYNSGGTTHPGWTEVASDTRPSASFQAQIIPGSNPPKYQATAGGTSGAFVAYYELPTANTAIALDIGIAYHVEADCTSDNAKVSNWMEFLWPEMTSTVSNR